MDGQKIDWVNLKIYSQLINIKISYTQLENHLGVANGPSKTLDLAKLSSNFTGLAVSFFFLVVMCVSQSRF